MPHTRDQDEMIRFLASRLNVHDAHYSFPVRSHIIKWIMDFNIIKNQFIFLSVHVNESFGVEIVSNLH